MCRYVPVRNEYELVVIQENGALGCKDGNCACLHMCVRSGKTGSIKLNLSCCPSRCGCACDWKPSQDEGRFGVAGVVDAAPRGKHESTCCATNPT